MVIDQMISQFFVIYLTKTNCRDFFQGYQESLESLVNSIVIGKFSLRNA